MSKEIQDKHKVTGFFYPIKYGKWYWEFPSDILGGFKSWFYKKWSIKSKNKTIWHGIIILGFKKLDVEWECGAEEAYFLYKQGRAKLYNYLLNLAETPLIDRKEKSSKCNNHKCGCNKK